MRVYGFETIQIYIVEERLEQDSLYDPDPTDKESKELLLWAWSFIHFTVICMEVMILLQTCRDKNEFVADLYNIPSLPPF